MLSKQHSNETNGTLNATVSLKAFWHSNVIKIPSISVAAVAFFPCKSHHGLLETTSGPMENPRFLGTKIHGPDGKSQQIIHPKRKPSSPDLPVKPSCPTSKVGFNAASFGRNHRLGVQRQRSGSSPVPNLVEVRVMKKTKKEKKQLHFLKLTCFHCK